METPGIRTNALVGETTHYQSTLRKALLICGILSSLLYVATLTYGATQWEGYSPATHTISELFAIGAPTRLLVVPFLIAYDVLLWAFGVGVWLSAGQKRALRIAAILIITKEIFGFLGTAIFPMHLREAEKSLTDTMHALLTMLGVFLCMLPAMGFSAAVFGKKFRIYTIATILVFVACAVWTFVEAPQMAANLPTPWIGLRERICAYSYMLWIVVLAFTMLRLKQPERISLEGRLPGTAAPQA